MRQRILPILLAAAAFQIGQAVAQSPAGDHATGEVAKARASAAIAGHTLGKVQRWLHEAALPTIDPKTKLYISSDHGSARYRESLWNYDDTAADTYQFLFWAAWYTDRDTISGPILDVLEAEQRLCNHLDRIYEPHNIRIEMTNQTALL